MSNVIYKALVNALEPKDSEFPLCLYEVYVSSNNTFIYPHFHIKPVQDGWDIRVNMDGSIHSIKVKGKNMQNEYDFPEIEKLLKSWLPKSHTYAFGKMSHIRYIKAMWNDNNPTALQVPL